jgi:hypothetical protein
MARTATTEGHLLSERLRYQRRLSVATALGVQLDEPRVLQSTILSAFSARDATFQSLPRSLTETAHPGPHQLDLVWSDP